MVLGILNRMKIKLVWNIFFFRFIILDLDKVLIDFFTQLVKYFAIFVNKSIEFIYAIKSTSCLKIILSKLILGSILSIIIIWVSVSQLDVSAIFNIDLFSSLRIIDFSALSMDQSIKSVYWIIFMLHVASCEIFLDWFLKVCIKWVLH